MQQWQPLAQYLSESIEGWKFEIVPVTLISAADELRSNSLEFLITNPGHYVTLAQQLDLSVLATREHRTKLSGEGLLRFGTVIFCLKESGVQNVGELKGKQIAAVSPDAFGGFQLAWSELTNHEVDPFSDTESIRFMGFPQDAIITAVQYGDVDAGIIRSGLLENLHADGLINIDDFVVLNNNHQPGYPYKVSGKLYPEWPFTANPATDKRLREAVSVALSVTQIPAIQTKYSLKDIWSSPVSYRSVRELTAKYLNRDSAGGGAILTFFLIGSIVVLAIIILMVVVMARAQAGWIANSANETDVEAKNDADSPELQDVRARFDKLTKRELEILLMICAGMHSKNIAENLGISPKTVEYHRSNLLKKTGAKTSVRLVQIATRLGYDQGETLG